MTIFSKDIICNTELETKHLAERFASLVEKGDVFALYGTLGAGKSTFSRYLIQKICKTEDVPSPTFTLVQLYDTADFTIYHYDMYRLKTAEEAYELDIEDAFYNGVCLVEWPEKIASLLPRDIWKITISTKASSRIFHIEINSQQKVSRFEEVFI